MANNKPIKASTPPPPAAFGVEISKDCSWDTHIRRRSENDRMGVILTDAHLDTRSKKCILIYVIVTKLQYAGQV